MKAEEFRIGNFIGFKHGAEIDPYSKITGILSNNKIYYLFHSHNDDKKPESNLRSWTQHIKPIPLTEEWLKKFGFVFKDMDDLGVYIYLDISDEITLNLVSGTIWMGGYDTKIKHVHQLQNLFFAITGEELTLKD